MGHPAFEAAEFLKDLLPQMMRWPNVDVRFFGENEAYVLCALSMNLPALRVRIHSDRSVDYAVTDNQKNRISPVYDDLAQAVAEVAIAITEIYMDVTWQRELARRAAREAAAEPELAVRCGP